VTGGGAGPLVVVLDDYQRVARAAAPWGELEDELGAEVRVLHRHLLGEELVAALRGAQVVVAMRERTPVDAALLDRLPELRLLVTTGMANAAVDVGAAAARGVLVCGTRLLASPAAELTWALVHAVTRRVVQEERALRDGRWQETVGTDLAGSTLGVMGLGKLGARVARVGLAFDMRVLAWSQHLDPVRAREVGAEPVTKDRLLAESDVLTLHLRLSERTRGVVGDADLRRMKPGAVLVNTSRGPLVDTGALVAALREGRLAGAGLDVFDEEPLPPTSPLRDAPRTVLTPHLGYVTEGNYRTAYGDAVEDVRAWAAGTPVRVLES